MDIVKSNLFVAIGAGVAAVILAPIILPVVSSVGRPLLKSAVRTGLLAYERGREAVAVAGEHLEDLIAEVRSEHAGPAEAAAPAAASAPYPASHAHPNGNGHAEPASGVPS